MSEDRGRWREVGPEERAGQIRDKTNRNRIRNCRGHILFVDDDAILVELGKDMLEGLGYSVTAFMDSTEALKYFSLFPDRFDAVITDQTMPSITGLQLAKTLLNIRPGIPIILWTGYSEGVSMDTALQAGIRTLLIKPVVKRELAEAMSQILDMQVTEPRRKRGRACRRGRAGCYKCLAEPNLDRR
jgi:CheY-like chemotaxis protein